MHSVQRAIAAYYQNHFDNKIILLKRKNRKAKCKYLCKILLYCGILKKECFNILIKKTPTQHIRVPLNLVI